MIYNLKTNLSRDIIENGVYESLPKPSQNLLSEYLKEISKEINDCPYLHCPDYNLLVPIYSELRVDGVNIYETIEDICRNWWYDEITNGHK